MMNQIRMSNFEIRHWSIVSSLRFHNSSLPFRLLLSRLKPSSGSCRIAPTSYRRQHCHPERAKRRGICWFRRLVEVGFCGRKERGRPPPGRPQFNMATKYNTLMYESSDGTSPPTESFLLPSVMKSVIVQKVCLGKIIL